MSTSLIKVIAPPPTTPPRGAEWAASCALWLGRALSARSPKTSRPAVPASAQAVLSRQ